LKNHEGYNNIYTVFAGGDDLFLIGPWNSIIDFAFHLNSSFDDYVCRNSAVTLSAGISVSKPSEPLTAIHERAEGALKQSKRSCGNAITLFNETVSWDDFGNLIKKRDILENWLQTSIVNNAMLFRLNYFAHMAKQEKELKELMKEKIDMEIDEMECLKWHAKFKYNLVRNVGKKLKGGDKEKAILEVEKTAEWLTTYGGAFKISLWQVIYNHR
jgi:CRISPR-associated protein Csm1